jgi:hypothetical protein
MLDEMSTTDRDVLRHIAGEAVPELVWDAAMSVCVEWLQNRGYIRPVHKMSGVSYEVTDAGRDALNNPSK